MAKGRGLSYKAELDTTEALKKAKEFNRELAKLSKMSVSPSGGLTTTKAFDVKPLTAFQQGILKIKQETLELAKAKQAQAAADKSASLVTQEALKQERLALIALKAEQKAKKPATISNSQSEIDSYNKAQQGSLLYTSAINSERVERARLNTESAKTAILNNDLARSGTVYTNTVKQQSTAIKQVVLSKKEQAKLLAEEKYIQAQATRELKNNIREQLNAKGSLEQRRAALIRLNIAYDRLSVSERNSAAGGRLNGIVSRLSEQVLTLEKNTGRAQRNVGNYLNKAWGGLKLIANILPGLGLAGLLGFAIEPLMNYIGGLDLFKKKLDEVTITRNQLNDVNTQGAKDAQLEVVQLKTLYAATQNTNISLKDRNKNVDELQKKYPTYFGNMTNESILAGNAATSYRALAESIIATARARASEAKIAENSGRQLDNETIVNNALIEYDKQRLIIATATAKQKTEGGQSAQFWAEQGAKAEERQAVAAKIIRDAKRDSEILDGRNLELTKNIVAQQEKGAALTGYDVTKPTKPNTAAAKAQESAIERQRKFQASIDEVNKDAQRKRLTDDEAEVQAIKDKYEKLTAAAVAFNNDPKNKKAGVRVDASGYVKSAAIETGAVNDKNKAKVDKEADDERKKNYKEAYDAAKTTAQALLEVEAEYQKHVKALGDKATADQLANLAKVRDNAASKVASDSLTDSDSFKKLFSDLDVLTASEIQKLVNDIEAQLKDPKLKLNPIDLEAISKKLKEAKAVIIRDNPFAQVGQAITAVFAQGAEGATKSAELIKLEWTNLATSTAGAFKFVDDAVQSCDLLKDVLGEIGTTALSSLATIAQTGIAVATAVKVANAASVAAAQAGAAAISTAEKASVILAVISAALQVVQAIAGVFKSIFNKHDKDIEKSISKHEDQVTKLSNAYNQLERDINNSVGKSVKKAQEDQIINLKAQQAELVKMRQAEIDKKKTDEGKVSDYSEQIAQLGQQAIDLQNTIHEALTGTTAKNITDAIIQGFRDGKRSVADFAESFKELMSGALFSALQTDLEPQVAEFYERFISASSDGLTDTEYRDLQAEYDAIIKDGLDKVSAIDKITGSGANGSTGSSLQGDIKSITTEQAGVLTGTMNGIRLAQLDGNRLLTEGNKVRFDAYSIAKGNFDLTVKIEQNTANTVLRLDTVVTELVTLNRKVGSNAQALAANGR